MGRRRARLAGIAAAVAAAVAATAMTTVTASAHAALVRATPGTGERLGSSPGAIVLDFSEPLNSRLSQATVIAPDGSTIGGSRVDGSEIRLPLAKDDTGVYSVRWTTVSVVDGHVLHGAFRFGIGVSPVDGDGADASGETSPGPADVALAALRGVEYAGLLLAVGLLAVGRLAGREPRLAWAAAGARLPAAFATALVAGLAVSVAESLAASPSPAPQALVAYLGTGTPGLARIARAGAEAVGLGLALRRRRGAALAALGALLALAAAGHAAAVRPAALGIVADTAHLAAAGAWAGGILALATLRPPRGWLRGEGRALLDRFSPFALAGFAVTAVTGLLRGTQELSRPGDLLATGYGQVLAIKVVVVAAMIPLSLLAWRRRVTRPRLEAVLAVGVVAETALLTAFPLPPASLPAARPVATGTRSSLALPRDGDLTMATSAGEVLVGLTLRPGTPGPNQVLLYVLPIEGERAAAALLVTLTLGGVPAPLRSCGPACRMGALDLAGGEGVDVGVGGPAGGSAHLDVPPLPAAGAADLVGRLEERMHRLRTYRDEETIRPASTPFHARFAFQSPDRMAFELSTGAESVSVGQVRYSRDRPTDPWRRETVPGVTVPEFPWEGHPAVAAERIGSDSVEGSQVEIVAFFQGGDETPTWYRAWVRPDGLVLRTEMRAQGHFMDDRYFDFDTALGIEPPANGSAR